MTKKFDLKHKKIAMVASMDDHAICKEVCDYLHECGATITAITPTGQFPDGWDAGLALRFELADPETFDSLLIITDKKGTEKIMDTVKADRFISSFFERKLPVSSLGHGTALLGQLGLLEGRQVSADSNVAEMVTSQGALNQSANMTTDEGLTTAVSSTSSEEFAQKVAEEVKEGRHAGQHA